MRTAQPRLRVRERRAAKHAASPLSAGAAHGSLDQRVTHHHASSAGSAPSSPGAAEQAQGGSICQRVEHHDSEHDAAQRLAAYGDRVRAPVRDPTAPVDSPSVRLFLADARSGGNMCIKEDQILLA